MIPFLLQVNLSLWLLCSVGMFEHQINKEFMFLMFLYFRFLCKKYVRPVFNNFFKPDIFEVTNISMFRHYIVRWIGTVQ